MKLEFFSQERTNLLFRVISDKTFEALAAPSTVHLGSLRARSKSSQLFDQGKTRPCTNSRCPFPRMVQSTLDHVMTAALDVLAC